MGQSDLSSRLTNTSDQHRMKVLAVLLLSGLGLVACGGDEWRMYMQYTTMKAHESCFGEENMKIHTVDLKKAIAKCHQKDAPELNLPPFNSPYRFINTLMSNANEMEQNQVMFLYNVMKSMKAHDSSDYMSNFFGDHHYQSSPYSMDYDSQSWLEKMMQKVAMKKMFENNMKENMMKYKMQQMQRSDDSYSAYNPFNSNSYRQRMSSILQRQKRQAPGSTNSNGAAVILPESLDVGDRLADKLKEEQNKMESKVGNMTCVPREMGILNQQNELDFNTQKRTFEKYNFPSKWLKNRLLDDMEVCNKVAQSLPYDYQQEYNYPGLVNMAKVKSFMRCCKYSKMKSCIYQDVKQKLEKNFGSMEKILEQTQMTEDQLFPLVNQLLHGEEMEYYGY